MQELNLTLSLNMVKDEKAAARVEAAKEKKKAATETVEEGFDRVGAMSLSDKEQELVTVARAAFFAGEIGRLGEGKITKGEVLSMGAKILAEREELLREERIQDVLQHKPENFHVLTKDEQLPGFVKRIREEVRRQRAEWPNKWDVLGVQSMTAGDYEGTGIDSYIDLTIGFSIWLPLLDEGYYLAYGHVAGCVDSPYAFQPGDEQLTRSKVIAAISPYLSAATEGKTFHMGATRYDLHVAVNDGYEIGGCVWDTRDAMYLLSEHLEKYGLKPLTEKYGARYGIEGPIYTFDDLFGNRSPAPFNTELVGIYAIKDVLYGWKLFEWQFEQMAKTGRLLECYTRIDSKLPDVDVFMTRSGFVIDLEELEKLDTEFTAKMEESRAEVFTGYGIGPEFLHKMSLTVYGKKIEEWTEKQKTRIAKHSERIQKLRQTVAECIAAGKTGLKKYTQAVEQIAKLEAETFADPIPENAPDYIQSFEFTNGNHLAYLIYDHLGIDDRTAKVKRGKKRSTAHDVLEMYYADEEALKPLATVAEYEKLLNTYVRKIPNALEVDGRMHAVFDATGTATGRYSSSAYNGRPIDILDEFIA